MNRARPTLAKVAAALLALVMLSYASTRSILMQVATPAFADAMPICTGGVTGAIAMSMPATSVDPAQGAAGRHPDGLRHKSSCPYCSAAAHAPTLNVVAPLRPTTACTFAAFRVVASHGPRGPPALSPRARGPPTDPVPL